MANKKTFLYFAILALSFLPFLLSAQGGLSSLNNALGGVCAGIRAILPVAAMIGVVGSGATYIAGQFMGAETRARATVWATSMLIGSAVAVLIVVIAPPVLSTVYGTSGFACNGTLSGGGGTINTPCGQIDSGVYKCCTYNSMAKLCYAYEGCYNGIDAGYSFLNCEWPGYGSRPCTDADPSFGGC